MGNLVVVQRVCGIQVAVVVAEVAFDLRVRRRRQRATAACRGRGGTRNVDTSAAELLWGGEEVSRRQFWVRHVCIRGDDNDRKQRFIKELVSNQISAPLQGRKKTSARPVTLFTCQSRQRDASI